MRKTIRIGLIALLCAALVVGYYYYLSHRDDHRSVEDTTQLTEVDKILTTDLSKDYPSSPRAVVKYYNRIITAFYGEKYSQKELEQMADQARSLMDEELLEHNSRAEYLTALQADIADYANREKKIVQSSVSDSDDITYATIEGSYCAYVKAYYFCKEGNQYSRTYQEFVLRRNEEGQWKILSFRLTKGDEG